MRIFELPLSLWPGRELALGIVVERQTVTNTGWNLFLGNGAAAHGDITGCTITLAATCDDTLAIFVNGIPVKDDGNLFPTDGTVFDLFAIAVAAGVTLATGDLIELFSKDVIVGLYSTQPWTAGLTFDDGSTQEISGGAYQGGASDFAPHYRSLGAFTLGTKPANFATSYQRVDAFQRHAMRGSLVNDYAATAPVIDVDGLIVALTGVDTTLGEFTEFSAHVNDLLVLIGEELFSVAGATLVSPNTYRLAVFRARLGTSKQSHAANDDVYLFTRDELFVFEHLANQPGNLLAFKIPLLGGGSPDEDAVTATGFSVTGSRIAAPVSNLAVDDQIAGAVRAAATDIDVTWSLPELLAVPRGWSFQTRLQVIVDGNPVLEVVSAVESTTILAATLEALLTSGDFTIRARLEATANGLTLQSEPVELTVDAL